MIRLGELESYMQRLLSEGEPLRVLHLGRQVLRQFPQHLTTYLLLLDATLDAQRWDDSCDVAERLLTADPLAARAWWSIAFATQAARGASAAGDAWRRAFDFSPYDEITRAALRRCLDLRSYQLLLPTPAALAHLYLRARRWNDAAAAYAALDQNALRRYDVRSGYCLALWYTGGRARAVESALALVAEQGENWQANLVLAARGGQSGEAAKERLRQLDPEGARARVMLGDRSPMAMTQAYIWIDDSVLTD